MQSVIIKHYITEDTATYPSKIVTKQQGESSIVQGTSPEDGQVYDRNM